MENLRPPPLQHSPQGQTETNSTVTSFPIQQDITSFQIQSEQNAPDGTSVNPVTTAVTLGPKARQMKLMEYPTIEAAMGVQTGHIDPEGNQGIRRMRKDMRTELVRGSPEDQPVGKARAGEEKLT